MYFILESVKNGKDIILYNGQKYRECYPLKCGDIVWRCLGKNCKASVKTNKEKRAIYSCNDNHSGPHPVTMRSMTPTQPHRSNIQLPAPPLVHTNSPPPSLPSSAPVTPMEESHQVRCQQQQQEDHTKGEATPSDLQAENSRLRAEITRLRLERQVVLDHSIESDQRLLQFTDNVFLSPVTMTADDQSEPGNTNKMTQKQICRTTRELEEAQLTIKRLEDIIASLKEPCQRCEIHEEEAKNMITSIRCLEEEITSLKHAKWTTGTSTFTTPDLTVRNRFAALSEVDDKDNSEGFTTVVNSKKNVRREKNKSERNQCGKPRHKIRAEDSNMPIKLPFRNLSVVGDSHARQITALMKPRVHPSTAMSGMCKPGAGLLQVAPTSPPPPEHCYIIMAGSNDVANRREENIFRHLEGIMKQCVSSSSVLLMPLTPRHDLPSYSPIHRTVVLANNFMRDLCRRYPGVEMLDISGIGRRHYTAHGLHLRVSGKRQLASLIVERLALMRPHRHSSTSVPTAAKPIVQEFETYAAAVLRHTSTPAQDQTTQLTPFSSRTACNAITQTDEQPVDSCKQSFLGAPHHSNGQN